MSFSSDPTYYRRLVDACSTEGGWQIAPALAEAYARHIMAFVAEDDTEAKLRVMIVNYHLDHANVAILQERSHPEHPQAWEYWMRRTMAILRKEGFGWFSDQAIDLEDLAQSAFVELVRSLENYQYRSRFSTWAHQVIANRIRRMLRDSRAQKRAVRPDSLDQLPDPDVIPDTAIYAEAAVHHRLLHEQVQSILGALPDQRISQIFHLWALEDRRIAEIGQLVQLHPSRVRTLLQQARELLRQHPAIQSWNTDGASSTQSNG